MIVLLNDFKIEIRRTGGILKRIYLGQRVFYLLCRKASYITIAAATEAFKELIFPFIGIEAIVSHLFLTRSESPDPSLPMSIAVGIL